MISPLSADNHIFYDEIRIHRTKIEARFAKWQHNVALHAQLMEQSSDPKIIHWREQLDAIDLSNELSELKQLNRFINSDIRYLDDYHHFHKKDYWADPVVAITEGGDCEDIALTKAAALKRLGWPESRMHLLIGYLMERGKKESHAVLLVETTSGKQYILRSINDGVISPADFNFIPIYAVDGYGTLIVKPHKYPESKSTPKKSS